MKYIVITLFLFGLLFLALAIVSCDTVSSQHPDSPLDFVIRDIRNNVLDLSQYKGKVVLIVNTATGCGLTPQFLGLQQLYEKYRDQDFVILSFPSNSFKQENKTEEEIIRYCNDTFLVDFPMSRKINVMDPDKHPLYKFLTEPSTNPEFPGEIRWNFEKFLIGRNEKVIGRFAPDVTPDDPGLTGAIEKALEEHPLRSVLLMKKPD